MSEHVSVFGCSIAEVQDDLLLHYIIRHHPADFPSLVFDFLTWINTWRYCVEEAKYRGLIAPGWAQWAREAI